MTPFQRSFMRTFSATLLALPLLATPAGSRELPRTSPEHVGLSSSRLSMITDTLKADVAETIATSVSVPISVIRASCVDSKAAAAAWSPRPLITPSFCKCC